MCVISNIFSNKRNVPRKDTFFSYTFGGGKGLEDFLLIYSTVENVDIFERPLQHNFFISVTLADHCSETE